MPRLPTDLPPSSRRFNPPVVRRALEFERSISIEPAGSRLVLRVALPLADGALRLLGAAVMSVSLDGPVADRVKAELGAELTHRRLGRQPPRSTTGATSITGIRPTMLPTLANHTRTRKPAPAVTRVTHQYLGSIQGICVSVLPCAPSDDSRSVPSSPSRWPRLGDLATNLRWSWHPETQASSRPSTPRRAQQRARPRQAARRGAGRRGSPSSPGTRSSCRGWSWRRRPRASTSPASAGTRSGAPTRPGRSPTSPRSSASRRCCRSTPAASASWPVTT